MAWDDRTPEEQAEAERYAAEYARTNDDYDYDVITPKGTHIRVHGINSARVVAGKTGTYQRVD
jgi:hypothetical protein